jgi:hypothetical protein
MWLLSTYTHHPTFTAKQSTCIGDLSKWPDICTPSGVEPQTTWSLTFCEGLHKLVDHDQNPYIKRVQCQAQLDTLVHTIYNGQQNRCNVYSFCKDIPQINFEKS